MAGVHMMLMSASPASVSAQAEPLVVEPVWLQRGASSGNVRNFAGVSLGSASPSRDMYLVMFSRTNTTTGSRRFTGASITVDGVPYAMEMVVEASSVAVASPCAVWHVAVPTGETGDVTINISGDTQGVVHEHYQLYRVAGDFEFVSATYAEDSTVSTVAETGGVAVHGVYSAGTTMTTGDYTVQDDTYNGGVLAVLAGRVFPTVSPVATVSASTGNRSMIFSFGQR